MQFYKLFFWSLLSGRFSPLFLFQGPEVRSGDLPQPIMLKKGDKFTFTIKRGVGTDTCVSVNYDDFVSDVENGDTLLIDGLFSLLSP